MVDKGVGDYFITDTDDESFEDDDLLAAPVVVPVTPQRAAPAPVAAPAAAAPPQAYVAPAAQERPQTAVRQATREQLLAAALDDANPDLACAQLLEFGFLRRLLDAVVEAGEEVDV
jgi:hypothetical protein